jgi:hypothetical protein
VSVTASAVQTTSTPLTSSAKLAAVGIDVVPMAMPTAVRIMNKWLLERLT